MADVNELIDLRAFGGTPGAFAGIQAGLWGGNEGEALGRAGWSSNARLEWRSVRASMDETVRSGAT